MPQSACFIDARSVSRAEAVRSAAALIEASRLPVFLVRACDVAGARAAIRLAERVGGIIDHVDAEAALRELDVMRSFGKFIVTPNEFAPARRHGSSCRRGPDKALARNGRKIGTG